MSAVVCPVAHHTTLDWVVIAVFGAFVLMLVVAVWSSWVQHRSHSSRTLGEWPASAGSAGRHGSVQMPHLSIDGFADEGDLE